MKASSDPKEYTDFLKRLEDSDNEKQKNDASDQGNDQEKEYN